MTSAPGIGGPIVEREWRGNGVMTTLRALKAVSHQRSRNV